MTALGYQHLEMLVRGGTLALLLLLGLLLWRRHGGALSARTAIILLMLVGFHVVATAPTPSPLGPTAGFFVYTGAALVPAAFWLFARCWFNDADRVDPLAWGIIFAAALIAGAHMFAAIRAGYPPSWLSAMLRLMMIGFALAALWEAWRGRGEDLVEARRRFRFILITVVGLVVFAVNALEISSGLGLLAPQATSLLVEIIILILCFNIGFAILDMRDRGLFEQPAQVESKPPPAPDADLVRRLRDHMEQEKAWRDELFSIAKLAPALGLQEYRLRRLINGELGYRNFIGFLNDYRLAEVCAALDDPAQDAVPISTIALDAGFGSLGPFNRAFRDAKGMTPSEYRTRRKFG